MTMPARPVAVVTGGARGIGRQIAGDLLAAGYRVVIGDLDLRATEHTALELGEHASAVRLDVTNAELLRTVVQKVESDIGPIEVWVNNAGIMPTGTFLSQSPELLDTVIAVDFRAVVDATTVVLPLLAHRGHGTIVNIASATGVKPLAGLAVYSGTKAAIVSYSDALRRELRGTRVHICVVLPNLVSTAMGAGITAPRGFGAVTIHQVSRATLRAIHRGTFATFVPARLGPALRLTRLLPLGIQDWLDDRIGTDRIGLGGDPAARTAYLVDVLKKKNAR
jgi:short-subunit dehydrogenase